MGVPSFLPIPPSISFFKDSGCISYVLLITCEVPTLIPVDGPTKGSLPLGLTSISLMVLLPLKWVLMPYFLHIFLILSYSPRI